MILTINPIADSYIHTDDPDSNYGLLTYVDIGEDAGYGWTSNAVLKFDFSAIPAGSTINSVKFRLYKQSGTTQYIYLYSMGNGWTETGVTWNNAPAQDTELQQLNCVGTGYKEFNSVALKSFIETRFTVDGIASLRLFTSTDPSEDLYNSRQNGSNKPELEIDYTPPSDSLPVGSMAMLGMGK